MEVRQPERAFAQDRAAARLRIRGDFQASDRLQGRNRDTAWYAIIDKDWPRIRRAFERWLADDNFDANGKQRASLAQLRGEGGE